MLYEIWKRCLNHPRSTYYIDIYFQPCPSRPYPWQPCPWQRNPNRFQGWCKYILLLKVNCAYYLHYKPLLENHLASLWYIYIIGCSDTKFWQSIAITFTHCSLLRYSLSVRIGPLRCVVCTTAWEILLKTSARELFSLPCDMFTWLDAVTQSFGWINSHYYPTPQFAEVLVECKNRTVEMCCM